MHRLFMINKLRILKEFRNKFRLLKIKGSSTTVLFIIKFLYNLF